MKKEYRIIFKDLNEEIIFTKIIKSVSIRGAIQQCRKLAPPGFVSNTIICLANETNKKLDRIEFKY